LAEEKTLNSAFHQKRLAMTAAVPSSNILFTLLHFVSSSHSSSYHGRSAVNGKLIFQFQIVFLEMKCKREKRLEGAWIEA